MLEIISLFIINLFNRNIKIHEVESEVTPTESNRIQTIEIAEGDSFSKISKSSEFFQYINDAKYREDLPMIVAETHPQTPNIVIIYNNNTTQPALKISDCENVIVVQGDIYVNNKKMTVGNMTNCSGNIIGNEKVSNIIIDSFKESGNEQLADTFKHAMDAIKSENSISPELKKQYSDMLTQLIHKFSKKINFA